MKVGKIKYRKINSFVINGNEYHIYNVIVAPIIYLDKFFYNSNYLNIPIVIKYDLNGNCTEINSRKLKIEVRMDYSDVPNGYECIDQRLKDITNKDEVKIKRVPIKQLLKEKWGEDYIENILNDLYENNSGNIPYSYFKILKTLKVLEGAKDFRGLYIRSLEPKVFIGDILIITEDAVSSNDYNKCLEVIRSVRINKLKERMKLSA